jgi:hypothetical protein
MLRRITIHPGLLKDARNLTNDRDSYTLADFIAEDKLIILAKEGKQAYGKSFSYTDLFFLTFQISCYYYCQINMFSSLDQISKRVQELTSLVHSVQSGTDTLKKKKFDSSYVIFHITP